MDKRAKKVERDLLAILLLYLAGQLKKASARTQGLQLIDEEFRLLVREVNSFYREQGFTGQLAPESKQLRDTRARITSEFQILLNAEDYWATEEGVRHSTNLLALLIVYGAASAVTVNVAKSEGAVLVWHTMMDESVCPICREMEGLEFNPEGELPDLPAHLGCRCYWAIVFEEE